MMILLIPIAIVYAIICWKAMKDEPELMIWGFIIGVIIGFTKFGRLFIGNYLLDLTTAPYWEGGIGILPLIPSIIFGYYFAGTGAIIENLYYHIKYKE